MGEHWSQNQYGGITRDGCFLSQNEVIATANADCERYENEIESLKSEIAALRKCAEGFKRRHNDTAKAYWETCAELAACAAGPWCFDVENAPKDGSEILAYWHAPGNPEVKFTTMLKWGDGYWKGHGHDVIYNWLIAFAVPNALRVTT